MPSTPPTQTPAAHEQLGLAEVWSDTVNTRELCLALLIAVTLSVSTFLLASALFEQWIAQTAIARAYAMLAGLLSCVASGAICAKLFAPKRVVLEEATDNASRQAVIEELKLDVGGLGQLALAPAAAIAEMKALGLYELFEKAEQAAAPGPQAAGNASAQQPAAAARQ